MIPSAARCLLVVTVLFGLGVAAVRASVPAPGKPLAHPKPELATAAEAAAQRGVRAALPPHVSTLLGLTQETACPVLQGAFRSNGQVEGFEVTEANHNDIVIFVVDEATKEQTFYLTSPSGTLRRMLSVKSGVGQVVKPTKEDNEAFAKEKKAWKDRLAAQMPAK